MAITDVTAGAVNGTSKVSSTTVTLGSALTVATDDVIVLTLCVDNSGTDLPNVSSTSHTGTASVTWTTQVQSTTSTATPGAGVRSMIVTGVVTAGGTCTPTVTLSAAVVAKTIMASVFSGVDTTTPVRASSSASGNSAAWSSTVTGGLAGDYVVGTAGVDGLPASFVGDSDTTNGTWTVANYVATSGGTATTNVSQFQQRKLLTASGSQTYNGTRTSGFWATATVVLIPAGGSSVARAFREPAPLRRQALIRAAHY